MISTEIEDIANYYGMLRIKKKIDKYYWGIDDWNDMGGWKEIPKYLYDALNKYRTQKILKRIQNDEKIKKTPGPG